ncbi:MAG: hypothetical protein AAB354_13690 [candidate division KSB1 bacterium]
MGIFRRASRKTGEVGKSEASNNDGIEFRRRAVGPCDVYDRKQKRVIVTVATDGTVSGNRDDIDFISRLKGPSGSLQEYVREQAIPIDEDSEEKKKTPATFGDFFRKNKAARDVQKDRKIKETF